MRFFGFLFTAAAILGAATTVAACGAESDCVVAVDGQGDRTYRIHVPETAEAPAGAIVFAHGYRGSAAGVMRNRSLRDAADRLGVALIAVNADDRPDWVLPGAPSDPAYDGARELDYYRAVVADAARRFELDADRMMATGFSAGGMMTWNLICDASDLFAAYAPIAGVFWEPLPPDCAGPAASVIHIHGTADSVVPLGGRPIGPTRQGDVYAALALYAAYGDFGAPAAAEWSGLDCERRVNGDGAVLEICLHDGGHTFATRYVEDAWRRFEALGAL